MSVTVVARDPHLPGEGPRVLSTKNVLYWCEHTKELKGTVRGKMLSFIEYDCVRYVGNNRFVVLPLDTTEEVFWDDPDGLNAEIFKKKPFPKHYNSTVHLLRRRPDGGFACSCQGYRMRWRAGKVVPGRASCAHEGALFLAFKLRRFTRGEGSDSITPNPQRADPSPSSSGEVLR